MRTPSSSSTGQPSRRAHEWIRIACAAAAAIVGGGAVVACANGDVDEQTAEEQAGDAAIDTQVAEAASPGADANHDDAGCNGVRTCGADAGDAATHDADDVDAVARDGGDAGDASVDASDGSTHDASDSGDHDASDSGGHDASDSGGQDASDAATTDASDAAVHDASDGASCKAGLGGIGIPAGSSATATATAGGYPPSAAIDGNVGTLWGSGATTMASLTVTFPASTSMNGVRFVVGGLSTSTVSFDVSALSGGSPVATGSVSVPNPAGSGTTVSVPLTAGSYDALKFDGTTDGTWVGIWEVSLLTPSCP